MIQEKSFYSIARFNEKLPNQLEFYPLLDRILFGTNEQAKKVCSFVNGIEVGHTYQIFKIEMKELSI